MKGLALAGSNLGDKLFPHYLPPLRQHRINEPLR